MRPRKFMAIGSRFMLAMVLVSFAALAQETDGVDDVDPAVATSDVLPAVPDTTAERDEIEPRVSTAAIAADVSRQESGGQVMDRLDLGRTEITGNAELPKVLYIVPWQKSDPGDLMGKPVNTLLDEVLAPLDREEFIRQVDYYNDLYEE